jgi:hypothetical protein
MSISLNDIYTWKDWGELPENLRTGLQKTYRSQSEALGVLKGTEKWLISHLPKDDRQARLELTTLFKGKIDDISHRQVLRLRSCGNQALNEFFVLPQHERIRDDSNAVSVLKKVGITLPKKFTPETQYLFTQLVNAKIRDKHLQTCEMTQWWDKAARSWEIDMLPHAWIEKLQVFFEDPIIKERLDKAQITIPLPLTREGLYALSNQLTSSVAHCLKEEYVRFINRLQMFEDPLNVEERGKDWEDLASDKISQLEKSLRENHEDWNEHLLHILESPIIKTCVSFAKLTFPSNLTKEKFIQFLNELLMQAKSNLRNKLILPYFYWELKGLLRNQNVALVLGQQAMPLSPFTPISEAEDANLADEEEPSFKKDKAK